METYVRSMEEQHEDDLCNLHTDVCRNLNRVSGRGLLYTGEARKELERLKAALEKEIMGLEWGREIRSYMVWHLKAIQMQRT